MDNLRSAIEILFCKVNPEKIIQEILDINASDLSEKISGNTFIDLGETLDNSRTKDELKCIFDIVDKNWSHSSDEHIDHGPVRKNVFYVLLSFAEKVLLEQEEKPICEFEQLLRWRDLSYKLGEDIFTTAYLAHKDLASKRERHYFSWTPTLSTNNNLLKVVLDKGVTDLHFHLFGSSLNFELSWLSLMNHITDRKEDFQQIKNSKMPDANPWFGEQQLPLYMLCIKAAAIRQLLFKTVIKESSKSHNNASEQPPYLSILRCKSEEELLSYTPDLQKESNILAHLYGKKYGNDYVDYAIKKTFSNKNYDPSSYCNSILYGERWWMYKMFHIIYSEDKSRAQFKALFYAYLIIKNRLRKELVQLNGHPGFQNFQEYQNRKDLFIRKGSVYSKLLVNLAINNALAGQHIKYLEARITPKETLEENMRFIEELDKAVASNQFSSSDSKQNENQYFYIFHFIKRKMGIDFDYSEPTALINPRHHALRLHIKEQTMAINLMRRHSSDRKKRLIGIDAASSEIGFRPEIFAHAFRYLKTYSHEPRDLFLGDSSFLHLGYTYHVGEDFLDIVDGLRAIDETVRFLHFGRGDRLGHCLVLGIDPYEYYNRKKCQVIISKQDLLDNIAWLIKQIKTYNISTSQSLILELQNRYSTLIHEIYNNQLSYSEISYNDKKERIKEIRKIEAYSIQPEIYYQSWLLRGDNPSLYFENNKLDKYNPVTYWDRCGLNDNDECKAARKNHIAHSLYKAYHFSAQVKQQGAISEEYKINRDYIELIKNLQFAMRKNLAKKHIAIEANPTSNKLIGAYKLYADHPLKRFFNLGLSYDYAEISESPQLSVSLNTDDLGLFATNIENEYALMAIAMEK